MKFFWGRNLLFVKKDSYSFYRMVHEPKYKLLAPATNFTIASVRPLSFAEGSKHLVATLNFHDSIIVPSYGR